VDNFEKTAPVGSFKPNKQGFYDLSGNVWEWCDDFYDGRSGERVLRGASWFNYVAVSLLSSYRYRPTPGYRFGSNGFRCVLVMSSSP
jgi:formylglycine-generating enzyme required for sulfatase activity